MDINFYAEQRVIMLQKRVRRCVCKYCGNELRLKRISFSHEKSMRVELFCQHCNRIEFGVEKETYYCAKTFVETLEFQYYQDVEESENLKRMNIAKVCEIISWADKKRGFINEDGYTVSIDISKMESGGITFMSLEEAETLMQEGVHDAKYNN